MATAAAVTTTFGFAVTRCFGLLPFRTGGSLATRRERALHEERATRAEDDENGSNNGGNNLLHVSSALEWNNGVQEFGHEARAHRLCRLS